MVYKGHIWFHVILLVPLNQKPYYFARNTEDKMHLPIRKMSLAVTSDSMNPKIKGFWVLLNKISAENCYFLLNFIRPYIYQNNSKDPIASINMNL